MRVLVGVSSQGGGSGIVVGADSGVLDSATVLATSTSWLLDSSSSVVVVLPVPVLVLSLFTSTCFNCTVSATGFSSLGGATGELENDKGFLNFRT